MIFNVTNNGVKELRELTGNYYANNEFTKIIGEIHAATDELIGVISESVYHTIEGYYLSAVEGKDELIRAVQRPIAMLATLRMYQKNDLSHEDSGRKFKIDSENERLPWEWQLDRDDAIHLEDYYKGIDALIRILNKSDLKEWKESATFKRSQKMIIRSGTEFESYFPIDRSERTYILLAPFIREVQILHVERSYGDNWSDLLALGDDDKAHYAACKATALLAISYALKRNQFKLITPGVLRSYISTNGAMSSEPATLEDIKIIAEWMYDDGMMWLDEMKKARNGGNVERPLMPENDKKNKYMRL